MKKSTQTSICCLIGALIIAGIVVLLACCCMLPGAAYATQMALCITICLLMLLFVLSAISACHCLRRLFVALCRYGGAFTVALIITLFLSIALLAIPDILCCYILYLIVLFFNTLFFVYAIMLLAAIVYTLCTLGCPRCPTPTPRPCKDADLDDFQM